MLEQWLQLALFLWWDILLVNIPTAKQSRKEIELAAAKLVEDKQAEDKASILSSDTVKEFLTQYYTKEKLGENNTRIQPYMTESAYSQELTSQNDAMNQVIRTIFWIIIWKSWYLC